MESIKNEIFELLLSIGLLIVIIAMVVLSMSFTINTANKEYNHGICECGGELILEDRVGHRTITDFYYNCNKCGKTKVIESYKQPE